VGLEIERKFLVHGPLPDEVLNSPCKSIHQGYLNFDKERCVRVRTVELEPGSSTALFAHAFITVKGKAQGLTRAEYEYEIPYEEGVNLLKMCLGHPIEKRRYFWNGWEVDVFEGLNKPLVMAEIELKSEDEKFVSPSWLGMEVSHDGRYTNLSLAQFPFGTWK
jgi:CYTH domain-containing protein